MGNLLKLIFVLGPLVAQGIITAQSQLGVDHPTLAGQIAGWILALTLAGRGLATQEQKNVKAAGSGESGGGA